MFPPLFHVLPLLLATSSSPWASAVWKIHLNFGREAETPNDDDWGASGARLALTVPVCIQAERSNADEFVADESFLGNRCDQLQVLQDDDKAITFVTMQGQQQVSFANQGAWRLSTRHTRAVGDASTVRMILELQNAICRNDVDVQPQRLYLAANAWRQDEIAAGQQRMQVLQQSLEQAQQAVDANLSHESGDRRLDGTNLLDTAAASLDMAGLVKRRDDCLFALRQAQVTLPYKDLSAPGDWPGSDQSLIVQEGFIAVKQKGGFFCSDELAVIGRWTATPVESTGKDDDDEEEDDDEYEYCEEDDEDCEEYDEDDEDENMESGPESQESPPEDLIGGTERFDRWRFLQKLLDEEAQPESTNKLLYQVLDGYLKYPRPKFAGSEATGSPERTSDRLEKVERVLELAENKSIPLTSMPQSDVTELMEKLEELLPDPVEEEDDNKGTWDTVIELNGRESVKYNQQNPTMEWQARCLAARLLIYYDFLILGVVNKPFDEKVADSLQP